MISFVAVWTEQGLMYEFHWTAWNIQILFKGTILTQSSTDRVLSSEGVQGNLQNLHIKSMHMTYDPRRMYLILLIVTACWSMWIHKKQKDLCFLYEFGCQCVRSACWCTSVDFCAVIYKHVGSKHLGLYNEPSHFDKRIYKRWINQSNRFSE